MPRPRRRRAWRILLLVVLLLAACGVWLWTTARSAPAWYRPPDPADPRVQEIAEAMEYRLVEEFHKIRDDGEPWTVTIGEDQFNAWLAARMPEWIAHEQDLNWPAELGTPQIHVEDDRLSLAVAVKINNRRQVVTTRIDPEIIDGRIQLNIDRVGLGRVTLPGEPAEKLLEVFDELAPAGVVDQGVLDQYLSVLTGDEPFSSQVDLSDGRAIEMLELSLAGGAITLTNRTRPAGP